LCESEPVNLPKDLLQRGRALAAELGYSSVDDLIAHLLERALRESGEPGGQEDRAQVLERLRDLGYL